MIKRLFATGGGGQQRPPGDEEPPPDEPVSAPVDGATTFAPKEKQK